MFSSKSDNRDAILSTKPKPTTKPRRDVLAKPRPDSVFGDREEPSHCDQRPAEGGRCFGSFTK